MIWSSGVFLFREEENFQGGLFPRENFRLGGFDRIPIQNSD